MAASVGRDLPSFVTVPQGSTDPAASMVRRNNLTVFHIRNPCSSLHIFCTPFLRFALFFVFVLLWEWCDCTWIVETVTLHIYMELFSGFYPCPLSITVCGCCMQFGNSKSRSHEKSSQTDWKWYQAAVWVKTPFWLSWWSPQFGSLSVSAPSFPHWTPSEWSLFSTSEWESPHISSWLLYQQPKYFISNPIVEFELLK